MARWTPFATTMPKSEKPLAGRTGVTETPVEIRTAVRLDQATREDVRRRLARKVGKFALHVERLSVRFEDVNGPKGGVDVVCRVKAELSSLPSVVVQERAADPGLAMRRAAEVLGSTLKRTLGKSSFSQPRLGKQQRERGAAASPRPMRDDDGSLIGGRVGHSPADLEDALDRPEKRRRDAFVDPAQPGVSASDRRAGYGATAARNAKRNTSGMQAALEDSRTTPSRKSTRRSVNRAKAATPQQLTAQLAVHDPGPRAERERAHKGRPRGRR